MRRTERLSGRHKWRPGIARASSPFLFTGYSRVIQKGSLRCTDLNLETGPVQEDFVRRWQLEAAFKDVRAHLSEETQRQWTEVVTSEPWQEQGA